MTNFDIFKQEPKFDSFIDIAITAEKTINIDTNTCIVNCRRALESAVKWMYSVDCELRVPYRDNLSSLMHTDDFRNIVDFDIWERLDFIRKYGNEAVHNSKKISRDVAQVCLKNLFIFIDFISYCYGDNYVKQEYKEVGLEKTEKKIPDIKADVEIDLAALIEENKVLKAQLSNRRAEQSKTYVPKPLDLTEYKTRKLYIDAMLLDAGWSEGADWINEVLLVGMPSSSGNGRADYVLYDDTNVPLAIIEAKRTSIDVKSGRYQAKLYADCIEQKYGRRPIIFLTNGFETRIIDGQYPERKVSSIYSKRDLEKIFNLRKMKSNLKHVYVRKDIADRYYQEAAIKAVCEAFDKGNRRKALLVMATGSGKTRIIMGLVDVLLQNCWVKNILFLADRNSLVTQAKRSFQNFFHDDLSMTNLVEDKNNYNAHVVFSTYQTMMSCIDSIKEEGKKLFTCGHFDLIICDEAHRSIYNKYQAIFTYFDAPLVGLTATPKEDIGADTYHVFELEKGVPTYGYDLAQAVKDGYLVDFVSVETGLKFVDEGIVYDNLTEEEKIAYENTFIDEDYHLPEVIDSSRINSTVFNDDTIKKALEVVMKFSIKIDYGQKIGKTIIFAKNHKHAEEILKVFNREYPHLNGYAGVIDNYLKYAQDAIDDFSDAKKLPQIAISVDMLDTGIDVPEVVNLVFFKTIMSKAKFWQMIGRGTRTCPYLLDGKNKDKFYVFDFYRNFEFFRLKKEKPVVATISIQSAIFNLKLKIVKKLQNIEFQTSEFQEWRKILIKEMVDKVRDLDRTNFVVRQHMKYVELLSNPENYDTLSSEDTQNAEIEVAPILLPDNDNISAIRFDALLYRMETALLEGNKYQMAKVDVVRKVRCLAKIAHLEEIQEQTELIKKIIHTSYLENCSIFDLEEVRINLRGLMKFLKDETVIYHTSFEDEILETEWNKPILENDDLKNYKEKAEYYIKQHQKDNVVIAKLKSNIPLHKDDISELENILWNEIGTKNEYYSEIGDKPLGEFVRSIVGLDMNAAKQAFVKYLDSKDLNSNQIYFVNQIIEYIIRNGMMKDLSVLQESPFIDQGNLADIFEDQTLWAGIHNVINEINANALV